MKKIGIITFHSANNFGAVLQCYALQQTIKKLGFDVEIIDYRPKAITTGYKAIIRHPISLIKIKGLYKALKRIFNVNLIANICLRNYRFSLFRKNNLNTSKNVYNTKESLEKTTNSFHGTVFSLIFHKPFYTFVHDTRGERMVDLMEDLGLQDRIIRKEIDEINLFIDYEVIEKRLNLKRQNSLEFLKTSLGTII